MAGLPRDVLERLYGTPPDRFVAARDAAAVEARRAGDPTTAREITKLRRPTVAAWLVNLLALRRPELMADLAALAEGLRAAQRDLRGPKLRELSAQRRAVVAALVAEARALAVGTEGAPAAGRLPLAEVEATLNAALADPRVAAEVRAGRLLRATSYAGFGEVPRPQLRLVTGGAGADQPAGRPARGGPTGRAAPRGTVGQAGKGDRPGADQAGKGGQAAERARKTERAAEQARKAERAEWAKRRRALDRELTRARADQRRAEVELTGATEAERDAIDTLTGVEAELAEVERRRAEAEQEVSRRRLTRRTAERAATAARRRAGEVEAAWEALLAEQGTAGTADDTAH